MATPEEQAALLKYQEDQALQKYMADSQGGQKAPMEFSAAEKVIRPLRSGVEAHITGSSPAFNYPTGLANWLGNGMKTNLSDEVSNESQRQNEYEKQHPYIANTAKAFGGAIESPVNVLSKVGRGASALAEGVIPQTKDALLGFLRSVGKGAATGAAVGATAQSGQELGNAASGNASSNPALNIAKSTGMGAGVGGLFGGGASVVEPWLQHKGTVNAGMTERQGQIYKDNPSVPESLAEKTFGTAEKPSNPEAAQNHVQDIYQGVEDKLNNKINDLSNQRNTTVSGPGNIKIPASQIETPTGIPEVDAAHARIKALLGTPKPRTTQLRVPTQEVPPEPGSVEAYNEGTKQAERQNLINRPNRSVRQSSTQTPQDSDYPKSSYEQETSLAFPDKENANGPASAPWATQPFPKRQPQVQTATAELPPESPEYYEVSPTQAHQLNQTYNKAQKFKPFDVEGNKAVENADLANKSMNVRKGLTGFLGTDETPITGASDLPEGSTMQGRGAKFEDLQAKLGELHDSVNAGRKAFMRQPVKAASTQGVDLGAKANAMDRLAGEGELPLTGEENEALNSSPELEKLKQQLGAAFSIGKKSPLMTMRPLKILGGHVGPEIEMPFTRSQYGRAQLRGSANIRNADVPGKLGRIGGLFKKDPED